MSLHARVSEQGNVRPYLIDYMFHGSGGSIFCSILKTKEKGVGRGRGTAYAHKRRGRTLTFEVLPAASHTSLCFVCALMASSFARLSVLIKQNLKVIRPRTVVKCSWEDTFGMLLRKLEMQAEVTVEKIEICANDKFVDAHIVPIDAPVRLTEQFKCSYFSIFWDTEECG